MTLATVFGGATFTQNAGIANGSPITPPAFPSGFDAVLQFSNEMLNIALNYHLEQGNLDVLTAHVPYQPGQVSGDLAQRVAAAVNGGQSLVGAQLEVALMNPTVSNLWIPPSSVVPVGPPKKQARKVLTPHPTAYLNWQLQVNLFWPSPVIFVASPTTRGSAGLAGQGSTLNNPTSPGSATALAVDELPQGTRVLLAQGLAVIQGAMTLGVNAEAFQFWTDVNCQGSVPTVSTFDADLTAFAATALGKSLLAQAISPITNGYLARISPTATLAGNLNPLQIAALQLLPLNVSEQVLQDSKGQVLAHCVSLGTEDPSGSVTPFLNGNDFSYYARESIFAAVLPARWLANAIQIPIVANVSLTMPVSAGSKQTGQGLAQVQVTLSNTLQKGSLQASDTAFADPLQLVSQEVVELLHLWYANGSEVTNLGALSKPATEPVVINVQLFDQMPSGTQQVLQPLMQNFLVAVLTPLYLPVLENFYLSSLSGYTSSPLGALLVNWKLPVLGGGRGVGGRGQSIGGWSWARPRQYTENT